MSKTRLIGKTQAEQLLNMQTLIDVMKQTLVQISCGQTTQQPRSMDPCEGGNLYALMSAQNKAAHVVGSKVIVFPGQQASSDLSAQGIVPLFDTRSGALMAIVDGEGITVSRTAATSAAASDVLANKNAHTLAILGTGNQGKAHGLAICLVRDIKEIFLWDPYGPCAKQAKEYLQSRIHAKITLCDSPKQAVQSAQIVCTTTAPKGDAPILCGDWIAPGTHINAVGACSGSVRELDTAAVKKSLVFVDQTHAALTDGGDLTIPLKNGEIEPAHVLGELGKVIEGSLPGRRGQEDITLFESVGLAVEDLAAATLIYTTACQRGVGSHFSFNE